jgi:hypothetical protein
MGVDSLEKIHLSQGRSAWAHLIAALMAASPTVR